MKIGNRLYGVEIMYRDGKIGFGWWYPISEASLSESDRQRIKLTGMVSTSARWKNVEFTQRVGK
jgi:hypothetical protein